MKGTNKNIIMGFVLASSAVLIQSAMAAGEQAPIKLGVFGNAGLAVTSATRTGDGALGVSLKRGMDTVRVAIASSSGQYELSTDAKTRRTLAMIGMISTNLEGRGKYDPDTKRFTDTALYLDGKGAVGNIMASGRLFSVKGYDSNNGTLYRMSGLSGVGAVSQDYIASHSGLTGGGVGLKYRASDLLSLTGDLDWGWSQGTKSVVLTNLGADFTDIVPGTVSVGLKSRINNGSDNTLVGSYSMNLGDQGIIKASAAVPLKDPGSTEYGINGKYNFTSTSLEGRVKYVDSVVSAGSTLYFGKSGNFNLSLDEEFKAGMGTTKVGFGLKF